MIKNIVFDIGMVLVDFRWSRVLREVGCTQEEVDILDKNFINGEIWKKLDGGLITDEEIVQDISQRFPELSSKVSLFWDRLIDTIVPYDYSREWIASLKAKGMKVYLLTNYPDRLFEQSVKERFTFYDMIDGEVVSSRVKVIKPDKRIYDILCERYNLIPEECIFTDDRIANIEGAARCGFNAILFEGYEITAKKINDIIVRQA